MKDNLRILLALSRYDYRTHRGVANFAAQHNWHLNCEMAISGNIPFGWQGDGIISLLTSDNNVVDFVKQANVPFVDLSILREDISAPRVTADNNAIGETAAGYFLAKGYKHFAFFSASDDKVATERKKGFERSLHANNTQPVKLVDWTMKNTQGSWADKTQKLHQHLAKSHSPCAIFAARDLDASIVLEACISLGIKVPEQVAILGVDNNELITNSLKVPLSSVNHNVESLGYQGAQLLHHILNGECTKDFNNKIMPSGVTTRQSTDSFAVNDERVKAALEFMLQNYSNQYLTIDSIASKLKVSRRSLDGKFTDEFGYSVHTELQQIRFRAAKEMLMSSTDSINTIAANCGFNTPQYFNNFFKQQSGTTPLGFRKQHRLELNKSIS